MVDVTDRMALPSRTRMVREGSGMSGYGGGSLGTIKDIRTLLKEQEPLTNSSSFSVKQVEDIMQTTAKVVGDASIEWTKRVNVVKNFRSLCADPHHHNQIVSYLRHLMPPMQSAVKDLRSQVCREACITVAFIAQQLGVKCEYFMEPMMGSLFSLLVANAKVVSITGSSTILAIYEYVPTHRLIPPLQTQMQSKSKDIRRAVCGVMKVILPTWPASIIQKQNAIVIEIMKKGLADADPEARMLTRECFADFQRLLPTAATSLLDSLEPLQKKQLLVILNQQQTGGHAPAGAMSLGPKTNGTANNNRANTSSLTRQGSIKKTGIPMLSSRASPVKSAINTGRSTSAIDLQAANRARQHHFSTLNNRTPLSKMGRTNSIAASPSMNHNYSSNIPTPSTPTNLGSQASSGTADRSRQRSRISRLSQSQPGSRSNSPSSKYSYATYTSPYSQHQNHPEGGTPLSLISPPGRAGRRFSATSSASSSRDTSPTGRFGSKLRSRSVSQSPQVMSFNPNSSTAKLLLASREAEAALAEGFKRDEFDYGNHSDSEDSYTSRTSNRSFMSEFSPTSSRGHSYNDDIEDLLAKTGSAKWSDRKEGLLGLQSYLNRHGSLPQFCLAKVGQTFCRIFMDAHTKVLSLFLDVLHAVLYRHAKDLIDFTSIFFNRILTKLGADLLISVQTKLMKTLEILADSIPADIQFSAVTHYLCDPTQTPNSRSRVAGLCHIYNLSAVSIAVKVDELQALVEKLLDWCGDTRSHELRRMSSKLFSVLFELAAPQMTLVLGQMAPHKQDQAKTILKNHVSSEHHSPVNHDNRVNISGGWGTIHSEIQSLSIGGDTTDGTLSSSPLLVIMNQLAGSSTAQKGLYLSQFLTAIKESTDETLIEHHKEILKLIFDTLMDVSKPADKTMCFCCLEELCGRSVLATSLSAFAELIIVRVTDVQTAQMARDVSKAAENCGMALAMHFPPEILVRALCPIVQNKEFPVNQMAIKMLQRMCDSCESDKLRAFLGDIMNTLIGAYDHPDSAVRKASVFAMVSIHMRIGPELQPYLSSLSGSKLKLLQLYIQRAQQGGGS